MRAILLLICLLYQFALVECAAKINPDPKCGPVYTCFVPQRCTDGTTKILGGEIGELNGATAIYDDCPALFRYHQYSKELVHVSIESFAPTTTSIVFRQAVDVAESVREFSCTSAGGKFSIKNQVKRVSQLLDNENDRKSKLKCMFEVKVKTGDDDHNKVFHLKKNSDTTSMMFEINGEASGTQDFKYKLRCNPSNLLYNKEIVSSTELYAEVAFTMGSYYCKDKEKFKFEYKKEGSSKYVKDSTLKCISTKFEVNDVPMGDDDSVDIRCFAEAQYFCDYEPNAPNPFPPGNVKLNLTRPNVRVRPPEKKIGSKLECPSTHPHLVIAGMAKPIMNAKFECLNLGSHLSWTVNNATIAENGRQVSCTKELDCQRMRKIRESSVELGILDNEGRPSCHDTTGTLMYINNGKEEKVTDKRCNTDTGHFQFNTEIDKNYKDVHENTKFRCDYPIIKNDEQNAADQTTVIASQIGIIVAVVVVGISILVVITFYSSYRIKKRKKRLEEAIKRDEALNDTAWKKYCMDKNEQAMYQKEKEALLKENPDEDPPSSAPCADASLLGRMIMASLRAALISLYFGATFNLTEEVNNVEVKESEATRDRGLRTGKMAYDFGGVPSLDAMVAMKADDVDFFINRWDETTAKNEARKAKRAAKK